MVKRYKSIRPKVLKTALDVFSCAWKRRKINRRILTVIDYSLPSDRKRLWVFNLKKRKLLFHEWVSHGKHTGNRWAKSFSNRVNSLKSSLGVFRTSRTYFGRRGYSLRLKGLERGINHRAHYRAIVIHAAGYISHRYLKRKGFMGKSWGCPAVRRTVSHSVIRTIRNGTLVFSYVDSGYYRRQKGRPYYTPARRYSRRRRPRRYAWSSSYLSRWRNKSSYLHCSLK